MSDKINPDEIKFIEAEISTAPKEICIDNLCIMRQAANILQQIGHTEASIQALEQALDMTLQWIIQSTNGTYRGLNMDEFAKEFEGELGDHYFEVAKSMLLEKGSFAKMPAAVLMSLIAMAHAAEAAGDQN